MIFNSKKKRWLFLVFAAIALLAGAKRAAAFESWEHKQLSDVAYHVAMEVHCNTSGKDKKACKAKDSLIPSEFLSVFYDPLSTASKQDNDEDYLSMSYGSIVACVDYFMTTEKLLAGRENKIITSLSRYRREELTELGRYEKPKLYPDRRSQLDLDDIKRCDDAILNLEGMRAGHVNHSHFQAELLMSQRNQHILAISLNLHDRNLFSSLAINAISDHYLQDTFAPGHIVTWRNRLTDTVANAQHDVVNRAGVSATFDPKLLFPASPSRAPAAQVFAILEASPKVALHFFVPQGDKRLKYIPDCHGTCRSTTSPEDLAKLSDLVKDLDAGIKQKIALKGDRELWSIESDRQRFVILLSQVRSILDVLESGESQAFNDSFRNAVWTWTEEEKEANPQLAAESERDNDGNFIKGWAPSRLEATLGGLEYELLMDQKSNLKIRRTSVDATEKQYVDYSSRDAVIGISIGSESITFGDRQSRLYAGLDLALYTTSHQGRSLNNALWLTAAPFLGRYDRGIALGGRYSFLSPATELALSFPIALQHIQPRSGNGPNYNRWSYGVRVDAGFTSFLTFYLEIKRISALKMNGEIKGGPTFGAGIQFAAPKCRILPVCD